MSKRRDEIEAAVDAIVFDVLAVQAALVLVVLVELLVDVRLDRLPAVLRRQRVVVAGRVDDRQTQLDAALLDLHRTLLDLNRLLQPLCRHVTRRDVTQTLLVLMLLNVWCVKGRLHFLQEHQIFL